MSYLHTPMKTDLRIALCNLSIELCNHHAISLPHIVISDSNPNLGKTDHHTGRENKTTPVLHLPTELCSVPGPLSSPQFAIREML